MAANSSDWKETIASLGAGTFAGAAGILVGHPFDTLKTRLQCGVQVSGVAKNFDMTSIRQLYRGVVPPLVTAGAMQSLNFAMYENFRELSYNRLSNTTDQSISQHKYQEEVPSIYFGAVFGGGVISGALSTVVSAPVSLIKVRQQVATRAGVIDCARQIYRSGGISKFYRAFPVIFLADSFGRGVYLGTYEGTKYLLPKLYQNLRLGPGELVADRNSLVNRMISAATAGCISWFVAYPLDVVKSRMQFDINSERYQTVRGCFSAIWKEAGIKGLYRGITFTLIRAAPVAATILPVYEFAREAIIRHV